MPHANGEPDPQLLDSEYGLKTVLFNMPAETPQAEKLFQKRLFKLLLKQKIWVVRPQLLRDLRHIRDYVRQCEESGKPDLVESLIGMPDLAAMLRAVDDYFTKLQAEAALAEDPDELKEIAALEYNFRVVELTTEKQLRREGKLMQHCVGSYYRDVAAGSCRIFSLRDPKNGPHCTMEIKNREIVQFQGKQNRVPDRKYSPLLREFLLGQHDLGAPGWLLHELGLVPIGSEIYSYDELPDEVITDKRLNLSAMDIPALPRKMHVGDDLILRYCEIDALPEDLEVGGDLDLTCSTLKKLPQRLKVAGRLWLAGLDGLEIPEGFELDGDLMIDSVKVKPLPDNLKVNGHLSLHTSPLTSLPPGLEVKGDLNLDSAAVEYLPDNLKVGGDLRLDRSGVKELPPGLEVGGTLAYDYPPFDFIPEGVSIGASLVLRFGSIKTVPADLKVGGDLKLDGNPLEGLPDEMEIGGSLNLKEIPLTSLPKVLKVGTFLDIRDTRISELPENLEAYGIKLTGSRVTSIPETAAIRGTVEIDGEELSIEEARKRLGS